MPARWISRSRTLSVPAATTIGLKRRSLRAFAGGGRWIDAARSVPVDARPGGHAVGRDVADGARLRLGGSCWLRRPAAARRQPRRRRLRGSVARRSRLCISLAAAAGWLASAICGGARRPRRCRPRRRRRRRGRSAVSARIILRAMHAPRSRAKCLRTRPACGAGYWLAQRIRAIQSISRTETCGPDARG